MADFLVPICLLLASFLMLKLTREGIRGPQNFYLPEDFTDIIHDSLEQHYTVGSIFFDGAWYCMLSPFLAVVFLLCVWHCSQKELEKISFGYPLDSRVLFFWITCTCNVKL